MGVNKPLSGSPTGRTGSEPTAQPTDKADQPHPAPQWRPLGWLAAPSRRLLASLLVGSLVMNVGLLVMRPVAVQVGSPAPPSEISLGTFRYAAGPSKLGSVDEHPVSAAEFCLYITLSDPSGEAGAQLLAARRFRVQQAVEQLLRQAHGGDFQDPSLAVLKRQIREHINAVVGAKAVAEVIITNLRVDYRQQPPARQVGPPPTADANGQPWNEPHQPPVP